jgi:hypothetical protein
VATNNGSQETPRATGDLLPSVPSMPTVAPDNVYRGAPYILLQGLRHCVGWQDARKAGPSFVVTSRRPGGGLKVLERFALSERGWAEAWQALSSLDASAAAAVAVRLAELEAGRRAAEALAALAARSSCYLASATFDGGSDGGSLIKDQRYDLRFLEDRIMVCAQRSTHALIELAYADTESVEVSETASQPAGVVLGLISGFGLAGALLGYLAVVPRVVGLFLGAVVLGLVGGLIAAATSRNETIVRVRGRDAEFQFLIPIKRPHDIRRALSEPLMAIRKADAAQADRPNEPAQPRSDSPADQLAKLASLLQQDLITRDEFEHLKAKVIAQP